MIGDFLAQHSSRNHDLNPDNPARRGKAVSERSGNGFRMPTSRAARVKLQSIGVLKDA